jgi:hypothetical protein
VVRTTIRVKARGRTAEVVLGHVPTPRMGSCSAPPTRGGSAVQIIERPVVIQRTTRIPASNPPRGAEWAETLAQLARLVDAGRIYDRDLPPIVEAAVALKPIARTST